MNGKSEEYSEETIARVMKIGCGKYGI